VKIFQGTAEHEKLVIELLRQEGDVNVELLAARGLPAEDAQTAAMLVEWGFSRAIVRRRVEIISSGGERDPIFRAARQLGRERLGDGRTERVLFLVFSALAILAPAVGLVILTDWLRPSMPTGGAKRAFLLEVLDEGLLRTGILFVLLLAPSLLSRLRLRLGPPARGARRVAEASILLTCASLATWFLFARAGVLRQ
jgi:hypothetical protein